MIGLFGSNFFIGCVLGNWLLASYGDTIGRISLISISQGITMVSYIVIVFGNRSLPVIYSCYFLTGLLTSWRLSLSFIYG